MKKLFLLMCLISFSGYSQSGIISGTNYASYSYQWLDNLDFSMGFYCGATSRLKLGKRISFRPELTYYQAGYKVAFEYGSNSWSQKWTNHWLSLIGNLEIFITDQIAIVAGTGYNYKLLSTLREKGGDYSNRQTINYNQDDFKDRLLFSGNIGICYTVNNIFLIDLRYDGSLALENGLGEDFKLDLSNFRQLIKLGVGVLF